MNRECWACKNVAKSGVSTTKVRQNFKMISGLFSVGFGNGALEDGKETM